MTPENRVSELLELDDAKQFLAVLKEPEIGEAPQLRRSGDDQDDQPLTERELVELLLDLVNEGSLSIGQWSELVEGARFGAYRAPPGEPSLGISESRLAALRGFLEERVLIREFEAAAFVRRRKQKELASRLPQRTPALSMMEEHLPRLLNPHRVRKELYFQRRRDEQSVLGKAKPEPRRGRQVSVRAGAGGTLIPERYVSDCRETALNFALLLVIDPSKAFGADLCRCHLPTCRRFWLLNRSSEAGKPVRNYHSPKCAREAKTVAAARRKANQRKRQRQPVRTKKPARHK